MKREKKNIFDTEIEMIDLDSIGDLEFRYEELGAPNPELGDDLKMVMKETQVFSSDEIEKALEKNAVEDMGLDLGQTRVIDPIEEVEGFLSDEEVAETVNEEVYDAPSEDTVSIEYSEPVSEEAYEPEAEADAEYVEEAEEYSEETEYAESSEEEAEEPEYEEPEEAEYEEAVEELEEESEETEYEEEEQPEYEEDLIVPPVAAASKKNKIQESEKLEEDESYDFEEDDPKEKEPKKNFRENFSKNHPAKPKKNDVKKNTAKNAKKNNKKAKKVKDEDEESKFGIIEIAGLFIALVLIVLLVVLGGKLLNNKNHKDDIKQFASIGALFSDIDGLGNEGIDAIGQRAYVDSITAVPEEIVDDQAEPEPEEEKEKVAPISVNFSSIEKDLKIKFIDKNSGKLVTGIRFEVSAKGPNGKTYNWVDTDMDGVIYIDKLDPGNYEVKVVSVDPYEFPDTATTVKVQDTVVYQVINVIDEAVDMSQVNLAQEENQGKDIDQGEALQDTVKLVDSTATPVNGQDGFVMVSKTDIKDPKTLASAFTWGGFRRVDDVELIVEETKQAITLQEGESVSWDETNSNGVVSGDASGNIIAGTTAGTGKLVSTVSKADGTSETNTWNITVKENTPPADIKVQSITVTGQKDITVGESLTLSAAVSPEDATNKEIAWNLICDEGVATIEANGNTCVVKGNKKGTVSVIAAAKDGSDINGSAGFNIVDATVLVSDIKIEGSTSEVLVNQKIALKATVSPQNATNGGVTWTSSAPAVATVDGAGNVTGVAPGSATITATAADGSGKNASVNITVKAVPVLILTVTGQDGKEITDKKELYTEQTLQLVAKVEGYQADGNVKYAASNDCVTVSATGLVTAVKAGAADITVVTNEKGADGKQISKVISVTVKDNPEKNTTKALMFTKDGVDYQLYYKTADNKYVEAKWADYYKYNEFYIKGEVEYKYTGWQTINGNVYYYTEEGKQVTGEQVIGGVKYNFASDGTLVKGSGSRGIDVSTYNGTIDWTAVKNSGISFVIIRCGFRGYTKGGLILDSKYKSYIQGATNAGLKVGIYMFSQAVNEAEAVEEASLCVNLAQGYKISYPIFIDSEYANGSHSGRADGLDKATRTAVCKAFCETVKSAGYTPGVYASKSWLNNKLDAGQLSSYKIWLAHYTGQTDYSGKYDLWQHTAKGSVSGIKGNVDLDISYLGY